MRILGLDYGTKTVGVAVSDELLITAQGVEIITRKAPTKLRQTLARIEEIIAQYQVAYTQSKAYCTFPLYEICMTTA